MRRVGLIALTGGVVVMAAAVGGAAVDAAGSGKPQGRMEEDNRRIVTAAFDRWAAGGTSFFEEVIAPNAVWRIEGSGRSAGVFRGRAELMEKAIRPFTSRLLTPVRPIDARIFADGDHVIAHWEGRAIARDGGEYRNRYAWIFRMQGGKAVEVWAFLDLAPYDDVLRRIPAPKEKAMASHPYAGLNADLLSAGRRSH
jgi:ketosteroid isomerase-like protein